MKNYIDFAIDNLQHPFFMLLAGLFFYFLIKWSIAKNKKNWTFRQYWDDQKDEISVSLTGGLIFLVWDDETLALWDYVRNNTEPTELAPFLYLLVSPAIERIYKLLGG